MIRFLNFSIHRQSGTKPLRLSINTVKTPFLPITPPPPPSPRTMLFSTKNYLSRGGPTLWRGRGGWNLFLLRKIQVYNINYALLVNSQGVLSRIVGFKKPSMLHLFSQRSWRFSHKWRGENKLFSRPLLFVFPSPFMTETPAALANTYWNHLMQGSF